MPTIGIYVPIKTARLVASKWGVRVEGPEFQEVVRNICASSLDHAAGILHEEWIFSEECPSAHLHQDGVRCRTCGGSC